MTMLLQGSAERSTVVLGRDIQFRGGNIGSRKASIGCSPPNKEEKDADSHGKNIAAIGT